MDKKHDYGSILNAIIEVAKERGMQSPSSDYALACYQLLETAISEAEVWEVPLADIGLKGSRPRVSDVINKKTAKFTIDTLVEMLSRIGKPVQLAVD